MSPPETKDLTIPETKKLYRKFLQEPSRRVCKIKEEKERNGNGNGRVAEAVDIHQPVRQSNAVRKSSINCYPSHNDKYAAQEIKPTRGGQLGDSHPSRVERIVSTSTTKLLLSIESLFRTAYKVLYRFIVLETSQELVSLATVSNLCNEKYGRPGAI